MFLQKLWILRLKAAVNSGNGQRGAVPYSHTQRALQLNEWFLHRWTPVGQTERGQEWRNRKNLHQSQGRQEVIGLCGSRLRLRAVFSSAYLTNAVNLLLVSLSDVEDAAVGQGDGRGPFQHGLHRPLSQSVFYTRNLAVHRPTRYNTNLTQHTNVEKG